MRSFTSMCLGVVLVGSIAACGGGETSQTGGTGGTTTTTPSGGTAGDGTGATAGTGAGGTTGSGGMEFVPTPDDIDYGADAPIPQGESILFNDWDPLPNTVSAMQPDGTGAAQVFHAYRVWSMGVAPSGTRVAFACGDPKQEEHYGLNLGDAIQHSWMYDVMTQQISLVANGNINDECHIFGPDEQRLYVCRRYDFQPDFTNKGYRIGRIELDTLAFEFLTEDLTSVLDIDPAPMPGELEMLFTRITISGGKQTRSVSKEPLPQGTVMELLKNAGGPRISPDGARFLYVDYNDMGTLWSADLNGANPVKVVNRQASGARYSPDGTKVVYLLNDSGANCQHIEVANADGTEADSPVRIRDCAMTGEFITEVAWINRP